MRREVWESARRDGVLVGPRDLVRVGDSLYPVVGIVRTAEGWEVEIDVPRALGESKRWIDAAQLTERDEIGAWVWRRAAEAVAP